MKTIGIIGGLGPMSTVYYMENIIRMTDAQKDQDHPRIFLQCVPDIPDRTAYILGESGDSPLPAMLEAGHALKELGADFLTIPCVTAHYFYQEIAEQIGIPVLSPVGNMAEAIVEKGIKNVGIMATDGTVRSGILERKLAEKGVSSVMPDPSVQEMVTEIIYQQIKKGQPVCWEMVDAVFSHLQEKGAEKIILGCTELPLLKGESLRSGQQDIRKILYRDCVDIIEILAKEAVLMSGAPLKAEYREIIR